MALLTSTSSRHALTRDHCRAGGCNRVEHTCSDLQPRPRRWADDQLHGRSTLWYAPNRTLLLSDHVDLAIALGHERVAYSKLRLFQEASRRWRKVDTLLCAELHKALDPAIPDSVPSLCAQPRSPLL